MTSVDTATANKLIYLFVQGCVDHARQNKSLPIKMVIEQYADTHPNKRLYWNAIPQDIKNEITRQVSGGILKE